MLFTTLTAPEKRSALKNRLASGVLLRMPGAHAPIVARMIEEQGFDGIYVSGAAIAADLALPDIGLTALDEVVRRGHQIARTTDLPALIDIDTGFGEPMNVARAITELEVAGLAGCHIEDQVMPKRCGHLDRKSLIDTDAMAQKISAAVGARRDDNFIVMARTDAVESEGLEAAIDRAKAYVEAGADAIFPEALHSVEEFSRFRDAIGVPLLANMTEFGKTPLLSATDLEALGYNIAIYPLTAMRLAMQAVEDGLAVLKRDGTQAGLVARMQTRARLYEILRYAEYGAFDETIYNFKI
ncbi:MAG: methylisocitrate lyase [Alphaproteobacteria bacterium]|nr:methylisocitrate lyase [Alphaproteobacteria bacterium]MCZ6764076.1 methylisocitrate lyase [Alphaproteobacteria bacterium]